VRSFDSRTDYAVRSASEAAPTIPASCPACRSSSISTVSKSPDAESYWRCAECGEIWNAGRREKEQRGGSVWR
jgi:transposase-like protein